MPLWLIPAFLEPPQFKRAFAQRLRVPVEADRQLHGRLILPGDDLRQRLVVRLAQLLMVGDHRLELPHPNYKPRYDYAGMPVPIDGMPIVLRPLR